MCSDIPPWPQRQRYGSQATRAGAGGVLWGGVGWGAGQSKPSANGKHTFSPSLELPFLLQRGEVAGVQEGTGIQKQGTVLNQELSHATIPGCCDGDNQEPCKNKCTSKPRHKDRERNGSISYQGLLPPLRVQVSSSVTELLAIRPTMEGKNKCGGRQWG